MGQSNEFRAIMLAMVDMFPKGTTPEFKAKWRQLSLSLDNMKSKLDDAASNASATGGGSTSGGGSGGSSGATLRSQSRSPAQTSVLPPYITSKTQLMVQNPLRSFKNSTSIAGMNQDDREDSFDEGYKSRTVTIATGELVIPGYAVTLINGVAYTARADDVDRRCHAMAIRGTGTIGEIVIREGGMCYGLIEGGDSVTKSRLKLSVRPGYLTFDDAESPGTKEIYQEVGNFVEWVPPRPGESTPIMCAFSFHYCRPDSLV